MSDLESIKAVARRFGAPFVHPARKEELRRSAYEREGGRCFYCNRRVRLHWKHQSDGCTPADGATLDHIVPKSKKGGFALENVVIACRECNTKRGDKEAEDFLRSLP